MYEEKQTGGGISIEKDEMCVSSSEFRSSENFRLFHLVVVPCSTTVQALQGSGNLLEDLCLQRKDRLVIKDYGQRWLLVGWSRESSISCCCEVIS